MWTEKCVKIWEVPNIIIIIAVFWYCLLLKANWGLNYFYQFVYFIYKYKNIDKTIYSTYIKKKYLNLYKVIILVEKLYFFNKK